MPDIEWANLRAPQLLDLALRDAVVIVPVGSTEQHGPHLPVQVDTLLAGEVARAAASRVAEAGQPILVTPALWTGLAEHHMSFGGTITLDFDVFYALVRGVLRSIARQGFKRILLLNGHAGNTTALNVVVQEATIELNIPIAACTYFQAAKKPFAEILETQTGVRHACEAETSMLLALRPDLVDRDAIGKVAGSSLPELSDFIGDGAYRWRTFASRTRSGALGNPEAATPEKGRKLFDAAVDAIADLVLTKELWNLPI